ncbi:MAG TPA: dTDP-glucose 4,6-dehydratase [Pyrinomonadaceae bacterium]|nr:dTDP-glucose 4,6-dehydratase [Pyrinomonadaceae bacterium]
MHKIFITGGAGFIGSSFIRLALAADSKLHITNLDALTYAGSMDNLKGLDESRHRFVHADITDRAAVFDALEEDTSALINFAAESHVDRSIVSADAFIRTNVLGTQALLDAARERGVSRFMQISTDEVMGSLTEDREELFTESSPLAPNNPYAASKAAAEHLVHAAHHTHGLSTVITRSGNNYGPRQFPEKLIPLMISNALKDRPVPLYGDGRQVRDWIYVEDHCRALLSLLEHGRSGRVYNIGARNQRRNIDVAKRVLDLLGKPHSLIRHVEDRPGHDRRYAIDPSRVERETGWRPKVSWESGLRKTVEWYVEARGLEA